jgi:lysyl endopeptidase
MTRAASPSRSASRLTPLGLTLVVILSPAALPPAPLMAQRAPETFGVRLPDVAKAAKPGPVAPSRSLGIVLDAVSQVALPAIDVQALLLEDQAKAFAAGEKPLRFGVGRDLAVEALDGDWYEHPDGSRLWTVDVVAAEAIGLRVHFADLDLQPGSRLAIYAPAEGDTAKAAVGRLDLYTGDAPGKRHELWSASVAGERARIEYLAAPGTAAGVPFRIDRLQHLYLDPVATLAKAPAGPCHNDVSCYPDWSLEASATAGIGVVGSNSLFCSGTQINSLASDFTPYWLTANHCLDNDFDANGAEIFWFYQTATCGGPAPSIFDSPRSVGTTLLGTNPNSDYTLLLIDGVVPPGVAWAGWRSGGIPDGTDATTIHHPRGDFKRISFGFKDGTTGGCGGGNHVKINWTDAPTEPGSSGSGIFTNDTGQLFGQLHCGPSACGNETNDDYGSFEATYNQNLIVRNAVKGGSDDSSDNKPGNDSCNKAKAVKKGTLGNRIVKVLDTDWYKINVPKNKTLTVTLNFTNGNGDIDAALFQKCGQDPIGLAQTESDSEVLTFHNTGKTGNFFWQVFLFNDTRNNYDMTVTVN